MTASTILTPKQSALWAMQVLTKLALRDRGLLDNNDWKNEMMRLHAIVGNNPYAVQQVAENTLSMCKREIEPKVAA